MELVCSDCKHIFLKEEMEGGDDSICPNCGGWALPQQNENVKFNNFKNYFVVVTISIIIGVVSTYISTIPDFIIIVPFCTILFLVILIKLNIKSKAVITIFSTKLFIIIMFFTFWYFKYRKGFEGEMYFLYYIFGFFPAILTGLLFGLFISKVVNEIE